MTSIKKLKTTKLVSALLVAAALNTTTVFAHHSPAAFNTEAEVTVNGTIIKYSFRNPHVYMTLEVENQDGSHREVEVEAGAGSVIGPLGFTRDAVEIGDAVTVVGNPGKRNPDELMMGKELYKLDGSYYPLHIRSRSNYEGSDAFTTTLEGTWFSNRASFYEYLGESREWNHTPKGRSAMDNINPLATPQKDCVPIAAPTLMLYPVVNKVSVFDDRVVFNIDWMGSERIVYLDGREHPDASETFQHGHSVGHWEGDTLVIDSTNYKANPMGLSIYLPAGTQKHLVERIKLNEDGKSLSYSGTIVDPEFIQEPVSWSGEWTYRPDMQASNEVCDLEVAQRFLDD